MKTQRISAVALALSALHVLPASVTAQSLAEYSSPLTSQSLTASSAHLMGQNRGWMIYKPWMSMDVPVAWRQGFQGYGANITVVDGFKTGRLYTGNLQGFTQKLHHGGFTALQAIMIAPGSMLHTVDVTQQTRVRLHSGLNVINLSYGMFEDIYANPASWGPLEASIGSHAIKGGAVVVKAAGNSAIHMGGVAAAGKDHLNTLLRNTPSAIFVGALNTNGSTQRPATLANYSNMAGNDAAYQKQFLVVGVDKAQTGLGGTSFAAPIVSGYAAIVGSKFTRATPTQITNQLLNTARQDTVANYSREVHGRGEASLSRALAPTAIR
jgi:hypothetical protein